MMADTEEASIAPVQAADDAATILTDDPVTESDSEASADTASAEDVAGEGGDTTDTGDAGEGDQGVTGETYADFDLPEGVELDVELLGKASPLFKEMNLTQEQAQKFVDLQADLVQAGEQGKLDAFNSLKQDWADQSEADKEFGGDKFNENVGIARQAIDKFGTPELSKLLTDLGVGNHPEMIRMMVKVGRLTMEDNPGDAGGAAPAKNDRVSTLYPSTS